MQKLATSATLVVQPLGKEKMSKTEYHKNYYQRRKAAKQNNNYREAVQEDGVKRIRSFRIRKKVLELEDRLSYNEIVQISPTSDVQTTSPESHRPTATGCSIKEVKDLKNLIFSKQRENFQLPQFVVQNYKTYPCTDCGDRFMFESSLNFHTNRHSLKITFFCQQCNETLEYYNRCRLLNHIKSHLLNTLTINLNDIKIDLLYSDQNSSQKRVVRVLDHQNRANDTFRCTECAEEVRNLVAHFNSGNESIECVVCKMVYKNQCAMKCHLRIHTAKLPLICPECGQCPVKFYDGDSHKCESISRLHLSSFKECGIDKCSKVVELTDYRMHYQVVHTKRRCRHCKLAFRCAIIDEHYRSMHNMQLAPKSSTYVCCDATFTKDQLEYHIKQHFSNSQTLIACLACRKMYGSIEALMNHKSMCVLLFGRKETATSLSLYSNPQNDSSTLNTTYTFETRKITKSCEICFGLTTYECRLKDIDKVPNRCSKCISDISTVVLVDSLSDYGVPSNDKPTDQMPDAVIDPTEALIGNDDDDYINPMDLVEITYEQAEKTFICYLCKEMVNENWEKVKEHYNIYHKQFKCLDIRVNIDRVCLRKIVTNKIVKQGKRKSRKNNLMESKPTPNKLKCSVCGMVTPEDVFKYHISVHRNKDTNYQCVECGECFIAKDLFSTHLLTCHSIKDVDDYIDKSDFCVNVDVESSTEYDTIWPTAQEQSFKTNECSICRKQLDSKINFRKHVRTHGIAFLQNRKKQCI